MSFVFHFFKKMIIKTFKFINYIRLFILNALFILIVVIIFASVNQQEEVIKIADNSYLKLNLNGSLVEQKTPINLSAQLSQQLSDDDQLPQELAVKDVVKTIQHAQEDNRIKGIILELDGLQPASLDKLSDIGKAINDFKSTNKPVYAFAENYSQSQYYLASYADKVTLAPNGMVILQGFAVNRLYFKELLDNLLITPHIFKVGNYKSFVEPFSTNSMSKYSKEANQHWLNQLWQGYIANVLQQRASISHLSHASVSPTLEQLKAGLQATNGDTARYAQSAGLVDQLAFYDDFISKLVEQHLDNAIKDNQVDYLTYHSTLPKNPKRSSTDKIAVIYGAGDIISGQADIKSIADKSFNKLLKTAADNKQVKAVVIRLNTPGGSAFASENIRQQVLNLKKSGKKVVVSMGSVTASGGYWIASAADKIITTPSTITGSIGIFGVFATVDKSLKHIGINHDGVSTSPLSDISVTQPLAPELADIIQMGIDNGYREFIDVVSEGRAMTKQQVEEVAQGRVWTGVDAVENGLADKLGNLEIAIKEAALLAELDNYDVITIEPKLSAKQIFINDLFAEAISVFPNAGIDANVIELFKQVNQQAGFMTRLNDPQNRFALCQVCLAQ